MNKWFDDVDRPLFIGALLLAWFVALKWFGWL